MADGLWVMLDDGSFELQEPYKSLLIGAKVASTQGWTQALIAYLVPRCDYTAQELADELLRRNRERPGGAMETFEEFVLEALSGDL